ncbi:MAG TPA: T9SS type A sorting domain-containing protein [Bacteroidetes bacterium]|nr:T9SS type A sorting domain-containing protein [Bacteroidota bacterium]
MSMTNALWRGASGCGSSVGVNDICAVLFRSCDMIGGQGSFASAGDFNMFIQSSSCGGVGIIGTPNYTSMVTMVHDRLLEGLNCSPCGVVVLPVKLTAFNAEVVAEQVEVQWTTIEERHLDFYTIEKSKDQVHFEEVRQVLGALNSNTELNYQVIDPYPFTGNSYYRLKSTDTDGEVTYSEVKMVSFDGLAGVGIFHVSQTSQLMVDNLQDHQLNIEIVNVTGQLVSSFVAEAGIQTTYDTRKLSPGVYIARVKARNGGIVSQKFFVGR